MADYLAEPSGGPAVTYMLVHLDDIEVGEGTLVSNPDEWSNPEYGELARIVTAAVHRVAARCGRRIVLVDPITLDEDHAEFGGSYAPTLGPFDWTGWEIVPAQRHEMAQTARAIPDRTPVIVAGFHRQDCVARLAAALARRGCAVTIHDVATAPLTQRALSAAYAMRG